MHIHIDALGGMAGDMFVAALLDAFPEHEAGVLRSIAVAGAAIGSPALRCALLGHNDGVLQGRRFSVALTNEAPEMVAASPGRIHPHDHAHPHEHAHPHDHAPTHEQDGRNGWHAHDGGGLHRHGGGLPHRHWRDIRDGLERAELGVGVRDGALAIFTHLAEAEARVHGIAVDDVAFHEVGAWDSIADIVAASHLVAAIGAKGWSVGALPLGSGRVTTAHGPLPVPAPATTLLLAGFATIDDAIPGERVTPTGAAILRHLCSPAPSSDGPRVIGRTGIGFGTRALPGISNCVRVLAFDEAERPAAVGGHRELAVVEFEVDDQSAEDLAMGLDRLREHPDVFDVVQMPVFGKKGRMMTHVRALARATAVAEAIAACFRETTTIGLRHHVVAGAALERATTTVAVDGRAVRVKTVERPGGRTAKAEADDALAHETHAARSGLRREAERLALLEER